MRGVRGLRDEAGVPFPAVTGASSLLVMFSVLCLSVFALLSLGAALANHRLSVGNEEAVVSRYQAEAQANAILAQLRAGVVPEGVVMAQDAADERGSGDAQDRGGYREYRFCCPVSQTQELAVDVLVEADTGDWQVLLWKERSTISWEADDLLVVWQ